ncbi:MAG: hypothetical protein FJ218_03015 [Ignavibacteria bacterium]|nr:hypothetical protein [Ignavibacteria bacterium]
MIQSRALRILNRFFLLCTLFVALAFYSYPTFAQIKNAIDSGDWNNPSIWSGNAVPTINDTVVISGTDESPITVNIEQTNALCASLSILLTEGSSQNSSVLKITTNRTLTVSGNIIVDGELQCTGSEVINISGNWIMSGDFIQGSSTVRFFGALNQTIGGGPTFYNFVVNKTGGILLLSELHCSVKGNWIDSAGIVDLGEYLMSTPNAVGNFVLAGNTKLRIGGSNPFPSGYANYYLSLTSIVEYYGNGAQTINNVGYGNLLFSGVGKKNGEQSLTINKDLTISEGATFDGKSQKTHRIAGNWLNNGTYLTAAGNTVEFFGTDTQRIFGAAETQFRNLRISKPSGSVLKLDTNVKIVSKLQVYSGILDLFNFTANRTTAGIPLTDSLTVLGTSQLLIGGENNFPVNFPNVYFSPTSTCRYYANGNQSISSQHYNHLELSGGGIKTGSGNIGVGGNFTVDENIHYADGGFTDSLGGNVFVGANGSFLATGITKFNGTTILNGNGNFTFYSVEISNFINDNGKQFFVNGNWINTGTYSAFGTAVFSGTGNQEIKSSNFYNIEFNNIGNKVINGALQISGNWINNGATLTLTNNVTFNGIGNQSLTSSGTVLKSLTVNKNNGTLFLMDNIILDSALFVQIGIMNDNGNQIIIKGNFANDGTFQGNDVIIFDGNTVLSGNGNTKFTNVIISNLLTHDDVTFSVSGNWNNAGVYLPSSGTVIFNGNEAGVQTISASIFSNIIFSNSTPKNITGELVINGDVSFNNDVTVTLGNFSHTVNGNWTTSPNATLNAQGSVLRFNGTDNQFINGGTFDILLFLNSGVKTITGNIFVEDSIAIIDGAEVNGGNAIITIAGNFLNNGFFSSATSTLSFNKNGTSYLLGDTNTYAYNIFVANGTTVEVKSGNILFLEGTLTENGYILGTLETEQNLSSANTLYSFGGIGAKILFNGNTLGLTTVQRISGIIPDGFDGQVVKRKFIVAPTNVGPFDAQLTLQYHQSEINEQTEEKIKLWRAELNSSVWELKGSSFKITGERSVTDTNVTQFSQWAFSSNLIRRFVVNNSSWHIDTNWRPVGIPTSSDSVLIPLDALCTIEEDSVANAGIVNVQGTLTMTNVCTLNVAGNFRLGANASFNVGNGVINFNGTETQEIDALNFYNLSFANSGEKKFSDDFSVAKNVVIGNGAVINIGENNVTVAGDWKNNNGTLFATGNSTVTLNNNTNGNQTIDGGQFRNLVLGGNGNKTAIGEITVFRNFQIDANVTFIGGNNTHRIGGNFLQNGNFVSANSSIYFNGNTLQQITATNFHNIRFGGGDTKTISNALTVTGNVEIDSATMFDVANFSLIVGGNWITNGIVQNANSLTMIGDGTSFSGATSPTIKNLEIQENVTATSGITVTNSLIVANQKSFTQTYGTTQFSGFISLTGNANLYSAKIVGGSSLTLQTNSLLGIADSFIILGNFDATTNSPTYVEFNKETDQTIPAGSYDNISFLNGGTKTVNGNISVMSDFFIDGQTTFTDGGKTITVKKNIDNNYAYVGNGTIHFTDNSLFLGNGTFTFTDVVVNANKTLNVGAREIIVLGNYSNVGALISDSTVIFSGNTQQTIFASSFKNVLFGGNGKKILQRSLSVKGNLVIEDTLDAADFTVSIAGNWMNSGTFLSGDNSAVVFNGAAQTISSSDFRNLTLSGNGKKTLNGNLNIDGEFSLNGVEFDANGNTISVAGKWTNNGTFVATNSTVIFDGNGNQSIEASNFAHVIFGGGGVKTSNGVLAIIGDVLISSTFSAGNFLHTIGGNWTNSGTFHPNISSFIFTKNGTVEFSGNTAFNNLTVNAGTVIHIADEDTIELRGNISENGYVRGIILKQENLNAEGSYVFGNIGATISFTGNLPGITTITRITGKFPPGFDSTEALNRYYSIQSAFAPTVASITLKYNEANEFNVAYQKESQLTLWKGNANGTSWFNQTQSIVTTVNNSVQLNNVTEFSLWAISSTRLKRFVATNDTWNNPANWSPRSLPTSIDSVFIPLGTKATIDENAVAIAKGMYIQGTLSGNMSSSLEIFGEWQKSGTFTANGTTVEFLGGNQRISASNFGNVEFSGNGIKVFAASVSVEGNILIDTNVTLSAGTFSHTVGGNWNDNGMLDAGTSKFVFTKNGNGIISGKTYFFDVDISNQSTMTVSAGDTITIRGLLNEIGSGYLLGNVRSIKKLNDPLTFYNFSNLGATINFTGPISPETTIVTRTTGTVPTGFAVNQAITRYFHITSQFAPVSASLSFKYNVVRDLQGLEESRLKLWKSTNDGNEWFIEQSSVDTQAHTVEILVAGSFSSWAISPSQVRVAGNAQTQWDNSVDWLPTGIPNVSDSVFIPTNYEVTIPQTYTAQCRSIYIAGMLTMSDGALSISRNWKKETTAIFNAGNGTVLFIRNDGGVQNISASNFANVAFKNNGTKNIQGNIVTSGSISIDENVFVDAFDYSATVGKHWLNNNGVFSSTGNVYFNSADSQAIRYGTFRDVYFMGNGIKKLFSTNIFRNVEIDTNVTVDGGTSTDSVKGNWVNNGTFISKGSVVFVSSEEQHLSQSNFNNIIFVGTGKKIANGVLTISGNVTFIQGSTFAAGNYTHTVSGSWFKLGNAEFQSDESTIEFNAASGTSQLISKGNFYNLRFSNEGGKTAQDDLFIEGNVEILSNFNGGNFTHTIGGNWTDNGSFTTNNGKIIFTNSDTAYFKGNTVINALRIEANTTLKIDSGSYITILDTLIENGYVFGELRTTQRVHSSSDTYVFNGIGTTITIPTNDDSLGNVIVKRMSGKIPTNFKDSTAILRTYEIQTSRSTFSANIEMTFNREIELNYQKNAHLKIWSSSDNGEIWKRLPESTFDSVTNIFSLNNFDSDSLITFAFSSLIGRSPVVLNGLWDNPDVWKPGGVPTSADSIYIPSATTLIIPNGYSASVGTMNIAGTLTHNGGDSAIHVFGNWRNSGIFNSGTGIVVFEGANQQIGKSEFYNVKLKGSGVKSAVDSLTFENLSINGVTFNDNGNQIRINGNIDIASDFTASGTTIFDGTTVLSGSGDYNFNNVIINGSLDDGGIGLNVAGNWRNNGTFISSGNAVLKGATNQQISSGNFYNLEIDKPSGTVLQNGNIFIENDFVLYSGKFTTQGNNLNIGGSFTLHDDSLFANNSTIRVGGDWNRSGAFIQGTSTIAFNGTQTQNILDSTMFHHLVVNGTNNNILAKENITVDGNFTVASGNFNDDGNIVSLKGNLHVDSKYFGFGTIQFLDSTFLSGNGLIIFNNVEIVNYFNDGGLTFSVKEHWNKHSFAQFVATGTVSFNGSNSQQISTSPFHHIEFANNGVKTISGQLNVSGNIDFVDSSLVKLNTVLYVAGNWTIDSTASFTAMRSTVIFNGTDTQHISESNFYNVQFENSGTKIANGNFLIEGNFKNQNPAPFVAGNYTHTLDSNFINTGTFIPGTSTIIFNNDGDAWVQGISSPFYNIVINEQTTLRTSNSLKIILLHSLTENIATTGGNLFGRIEKTESVTLPESTYSFGNIGAEMKYSGNSPGVTTIERISGEYVRGFDSNAVINRAYFLSAEDSSINGSLKLFYNVREVNGQDENTLYLWKSLDSGKQWIKIDSSKKTYLEQSVTTMGVDTFQYLTFSPFVSRIASGSGELFWNNPKNWRPEGIPTKSDSVFIPLGKVVTIDSNSSKAECGNITIDGQIGFNGNYSLNVWGNWKKNNTFSFPNGTIVFAGKNQFLNATQFNNVVFGGSGIKTARGEITVTKILEIKNGVSFVDSGYQVTVSNNVHVDGEYLGSGILSLEGNTTLLGNGTFRFGTVKINSSAVLNDNWKTIFVSKNWEKNNGGIFNSNGIVTFTGIDTQTISASNFYTIHFSGIGRCGLSGNIFVNGNVAIGNGAQIFPQSFGVRVMGTWENNGDYNRFAAGSDTLNGNISGNSETKFNNLIITDTVFTASSFQIQKRLEIENNGMIQQTNGVVTFIGSDTYIRGKMQLNNIIIPQQHSLKIEPASYLRISGSINGNDLNNVIITADTSSVIEFNGSGAQTIPAIVYGELRLSNTGNKTAYGPDRTLKILRELHIDTLTTFKDNRDLIVLEGSIINKGNYVASGTLRVDNNQSISTLFGTGSYQFNHIIILDDNTLSTESLYVAVKGNLQNTGILKTFGTFDFNGVDVSQEIESSNFYSVLISGSGVKTITGKLTIEKDLVITTNAELELGSSRHTLKGNLIVNGTLNPQTSKILFQGDSLQTITGSTTVPFHKLQLFNENNVSLHAHIIVKDSLRIAMGKLITNAYSVLLDTSAKLYEISGNEIFGKVIADRTLRLNENNTFNDIGLEITSFAQNSIRTKVERITGTQLNGVGDSTFENHHSIARYFDVAFQTSTNFRGNILLHYNHANDTIGQEENSFRLWTSTNNGDSWFGYTKESRTNPVFGDSVIADSVNVIVPSMRFTLADTNNALQGNKVQIVSYRVTDTNFVNMLNPNLQNWTFEIRKGTIGGELIGEVLANDSLTINNIKDGRYYVIQKDSIHWKHVGYRVSGYQIDDTIDSRLNNISFEIYGGTTSEISIYNFHKNILTVRTFLDEDKLLSTTNDQLPIAWRYILYKDDIRHSDTIAGVWNLDRLVDGTYTIENHDSTGWTPLGFALNGIISVDTSRKVTLNINSGTIDTIDFINFPTQERYISFTQEKWKIIPKKLARQSNIPVAMQQKPTIGNIADSAYAKVYAKQKDGLLLGISLSKNRLKEDTLAFIQIVNKAEYVRSFIGHTGTSRGYEKMQGVYRNPKRISLYNNKLAGELLTLKMNIAMSDARIAYPHLGEIYYYPTDTTSILYKKTLRQLARTVDTMLTFWKFHSVGNSSDITFYSALCSSLVEINHAFDVPESQVEFDTANGVYSPLKITSKGKLLYRVPFLRQDVTKTDTVAESTYANPTTYRLLQNYPNPFNVTTTIQYELPYEARVSISVYNILGQRVATLFQDELRSAGPDEVIFDASHFSSGVYFYRMSAKATENYTGEFIEVKRFVLLK